MARYAEGTTVSTDKSLGEMRALLTKHDASHFAYGSGPDGDAIQFRLNGRMYRFDIQAVDPTEYTHDARGYLRTDAQHKSMVEGEWRRRWRARLLWLKAQLEFAEGDPEAMARNLLPDLVLPDGKTFFEYADPQIDAMYSLGTMPLALPDGLNARRK